MRRCMWRVGRGKEMMMVYMEGREGGGVTVCVKGEGVMMMMVYIVLQ